MTALTLADVAPAIALATALIGLVSSVACVLLTTWLTRRFERFKIEATLHNDEKLEQLRASLATETTRDRARIDYEYEAIKRLYSSVEPLVFQLVEHASSSTHRVLSLARSADEVSLDGGDSWLSKDGYYLRSTIYRLMAPLAAYRLIQRKLTVLDLTLDPGLNLIYRLAERAYWSFTDDFKLAAGHHAIEQSRLEYFPNEPDWEIKRVDNQRIYWRQGFPIGVLDQIIDAIAIREGDTDRIANFGEFDEVIVPTKVFDLASDVFLGFHPHDRPVLWRVLLMHYHHMVALQIAAACRRDLSSFRPEFDRFLHEGNAAGLSDRHAEQKRDLKQCAGQFGDAMVSKIVELHVTSSIADLIRSVRDAEERIQSR